MQSEFRKIIIVLLMISNSFSANSQNRAPSLWLRYGDHFKGDILINTMRIQAPSPLYTYYCALQWNAGLEGGGYCGIQEHPNGRNFIFSIWDPISSNLPITAPYTGHGTQVQNFGGEGTGLKSWNFDLGWETGTWYTFVARSWPGANNNTFFGYWVFDKGNAHWYHLVTMDYPVSDIGFSSQTGSFIEDWLGNGDNRREQQMKGGWKRRSSNSSWNPFLSAHFSRTAPDPGAANYLENYDGGISEDFYFMKSGSEDLHPDSNSSGSLLNINSDHRKPEFETAQISDIIVTENEFSLSVSWSVSTAQSPQFSYHFSVFNNPEFTGSPILSIDKAIPEDRALELEIRSITTPGTYYTKFYVTDIFGRASNETYYDFFTEGFTPLNVIHENSKVYPNPVNELIEIDSNDMESAYIMDTLGRIIIIAEESHIDVRSLNTGIYFLVITDKSGNPKTFRFVKN